ATASGTASAGSFIRGAGGGAEQDWFASLIRAGNPLVMLGWFYLAGLALAFTPCVLPMVPILSGIIAGGGRTLNTARAFALSVTYVLGMALTYTLAGIACAAAGRQVQAVFQQWWVLTLFAALFVVLALSMLGLFTLQMPVAIQTRIANISNRQSTGPFRGVDARAHRAGARGALAVGGARADPGLGPVLADPRPFRRHLDAARRGRDRRPVRRGAYRGLCARRHRPARADTRLRRQGPRAAV